MKRSITLQNQERGALLVTVLVIMFFLMTMLLGLMLLASLNLSRATERIFLLQTQYASETGADIALTNLNTGASTPYGLTAEKTILTSGNHYKATYRVKMDDSPSSDNNEKIVTATGYVYSPANSATPKYTRTIQVTAKRSSSASAASIISRNVVHVASSVKEILGKDIFVNEYIQLDKVTNELIMENATVAGKNTSASNCSIGGAGKLEKPSTFTNPGQTKTNLKLAYNNCITPPGNTSNANFDVAVNQNDIVKVQSTYIPWNYTMDNTYQNSPSGCGNWTSGTPRTIPSTGNTKKTHYPDTGTGVDTGCGSTGTINLGSSTYEIRDHAHVRANLCNNAQSCNPTFNNTSGAIKYIFVEGSVNLKGLNTTSGSSPIVFVVYGGDPADVTGPCPLGGAVYLGKAGSNTVTAPAAYFIAVNGGVCMDGTKFGLTRSMGGVSGKNVYIATNSGTPFDLSFDPTFPVDQIPINLSWKAAQYQRLR